MRANAVKTVFYMEPKLTLEAGSVSLTLALVSSLVL